MSTPIASARSPLIAVILSLAATGLGQVYCGRIVRGLVMFLGSLLFAPAIVVAALLPPATIVLVVLILALVTVLGVYIFAVADAFRLARRGSDLFQSMDYNHPLVYALFILVGLTYSAGGLYFIRSNVFEAFAIPTASEAPTLLPGDRILVNKTTYQRRFVRRGDEVVFRVASEGVNWVKRVIALSGDTVEVKDNEVFVNGQPLSARAVATGEPRGRGARDRGGTIRGNQRRPPLSDSLRCRHEAVIGLPRGEGAGRDVFHAGRQPEQFARQPHDRIRGPWRRARRRAVPVLASRGVDPVRPDRISIDLISNQAPDPRRNLRSHAWPAGFGKRFSGILQTQSLKPLGRRFESIQLRIIATGTGFFRAISSVG